MIINNWPNLSPAFWLLNCYPEKFGFCTQYMNFFTYRLSGASQQSPEWSWVSTISYSLVCTNFLYMIPISTAQSRACFWLVFNLLVSTVMTRHLLGRIAKGNELACGESVLKLEYWIHNVIKHYHLWTHGSCNIWVR